MPDERAIAAIERQEQLSRARALWESHWQEIAERVLPRQAEFTTTHSPGAKRQEKIFDSTAPLALGRFASAIEGLLTPRAQRWHHLRASVQELNDIEEVRQWFDRVEDMLFAFRYSPRANFASQQHETYMSLGAFGSAVLFVDEVLGQGLRYKSIHLAECYFAENDQGRIDTNYRKFQFTARQAAQRWGLQVLPKTVKDAVEKEPDRRFDFLHCVEPREDRKPGRVDGRNMPWRSLYVSYEDRTTLEDSGFNEFPYAISRYVTSPREVYGRSPAMEVLADIKMLNEMSHTTLRAAHKQVDPPVLAADDGVMSRPKLVPNAVNYGAVDRQGRALLQPFQSGANIPLGLEMENQRRAVINDAFLVTLFQILVDSPQMTATEALIRAQEKGILLTPSVGRQQSEALGPMIERELAILLRMGKLPPMPPALIEAQGEFEIEYDSPLSRAQRAEEAVATVRTVEFATNLAGVNPGVIDNIDTDAAIRLFAEAQGARRILRGKDRVDQARQQRQATEALQQVVQNAPQVTGAVKDLVQAESTANGA